MKYSRTAAFAPHKGFPASGHSLRHPQKSRPSADLALIFSERPAHRRGGLYQQPGQGRAPDCDKSSTWPTARPRPSICNSGNANTCNADGIEVAEEMCALTATALRHRSRGCDRRLHRRHRPAARPSRPSRTGHAAAGRRARRQRAPIGGRSHHDHRHQAARRSPWSSPLGGKTCTIGGIAKGSGMIHPNMATMLVLSDHRLRHQPPRCCTRRSPATCSDTFNMVSVDGDTSTNDMVAVLANGTGGQRRDHGGGRGLSTPSAAR